VGPNISLSISLITDVLARCRIIRPKARVFRLRSISSKSDEFHDDSPTRRGSALAMEASWLHVFPVPPFSASSLNMPRSIASLVAVFLVGYHHK